MRIVAVPAVVLLLAACATSTAPAPTPAGSAPEPAAAPSPAVDAATAVLASASGSLVSGTVRLAAMDDGVHITGEVGGLQPGTMHGFHVHENGDCSAADASSAGGHFNPTGMPHGRQQTPTHHAGDMDNITVDDQGVAQVDVHLDGVTLGGGGSTDILGRALIVHAEPDDYTSQPSGAAGARVACGVITAGM